MIMLCSAILIINIISLSISMFFFRTEFQYQVVQMKNVVETTMSDIVSAVTYSDDFNESIDISKIDKNLIISIEDLDGNYAFVYPGISDVIRLSSDDDVYITNSKKFLSTNSNGQQIYFIKASYDMKGSKMFNKFPSFSKGFIQKLFFVELFIIVISIIIVVLTINKLLIKPLDELSGTIHSFRGSNRKKGKGDEIVSLKKSFNDLASALNEEEEKQTRIIASVSHDIKTPLTSIMGYAEQLKKDDLPEERRVKYTNTIYDKSISIKNMIEGLDDYLDYNTKSLSGEKNIVSVKQLLHAIDSYFRDDIERENVNFTVEEYSGNGMICVNKTSMTRLFGNVINNSIKHRIDNVDYVINIRAVDSDNTVEFIIQDNGEGVSPDKLDKIFEPLYTTDESRTKAVSGLGLSICKEIVEMNNGRIYAKKSDFDTGLAICFTIPKVNNQQTV